MAVPYYMVKVPYEWRKKYLREKERRKIMRRYEHRMNAQSGVGITFVGPSENFSNYVRYTIPGRSMER